MKKSRQARARVRVEFCCLEDDVKKWKNSAQKSSLSLSEYIRSALNNTPILSYIHKIDPELNRNIKAIGNNLNQIAYRVNAHIASNGKEILDEIHSIRLVLEDILNRGSEEPL